MTSSTTVHDNSACDMKPAVSADSSDWLEVEIR